MFMERATPIESPDTQYGSAAFSYVLHREYVLSQSAGQSITENEGIQYSICVIASNLHSVSSRLTRP
jgi:hypothetical protein